MQRTERFSLEKHAGPYETWPLRTRLHADGRPTGTFVRGYVLLHQFAVDEGWLLVTDYDCPFEEATVFTLLDRELRVLSCRWLGAAYNSFLLTGLAWTDERTLVARFGDDYAVRVTLRPWGVPYLRPRLGVERIPGPAA